MYLRVSLILFGFQDSLTKMALFIVVKKYNSKVGVLAQFSIHLQIRELEVLKSIANYSKGLYNTYRTEGKITTVLKQSTSLLDKITNLKVTKSILQNSRKNPSYIIPDILYNSSLEKIQEDRIRFSNSNCYSKCFTNSCCDNWMKFAKCAELTISMKVLMLELKIVNLFIFTSFLIFIFISVYFLFLNLGLRISIISHVTVICHRRS